MFFWSGIVLGPATVKGKDYTGFSLMQSEGLQSIGFAWRKMSFQFSPGFVIPGFRLQRALEGKKPLPLCPGLAGD